jgi:transposase InsO family protein
VAWWLQRKKGLAVNRKRVLRVMRERGLLVRSRRLRARRKKECGRVEAAEPNQIWQSDMTKILAGPAVGWAYLVCVIDCCTREIVGWNLSHRCRIEDALAAVEQAVLARLPEGSREAQVTLTTTVRSSLRCGSWKHCGGSALRIAARRIITRRATATSNGSIAA